MEVACSLLERDFGDLLIKTSPERVLIIQYPFAQPKDGKDFVLITAAHPYYFEVASWAVERLQKAKAEELLEKLEEKKKSE